MGAHSGREAAFRALTAYNKNTGKADRALDTALGFVQDLREKALATRIFYGVIQNRLLLDFYISGFSTLKMNRISPAVLTVLRMGLYQLLFLSRIPKSAIVNTGVDLAKRHSNPKGASFVNAVLRRASSGDFPTLPDSDKASYLSIKYSHPLWLVTRFLALFGEQETEALLSGNNEPSPTYLRVNLLKGSYENAIERLSLDGIKVAPHPFAANCLVAENVGFPEELSAVRDGLVYVQDAASQIAIDALSPKKGAAVLDLCAAPGGKSVLCAQMMQNEGAILSLDVSPEKADMIRKTAERLGASIIRAAVSDALVFRQDLDASFDFIVCDVPCSGFGVIRKKPDIRYKTEEEIKGLPDIQRKILENAARYLKKGGVLLYSTCTILPEENEAVVNAFLDGHPGYSLEPFAVFEIRSETGMQLLLPGTYQTDGFFFSKIKRLL